MLWIFLHSKHFIQFIKLNISLPLWSVGYIVVVPFRTSRMREVEQPLQIHQATVDFFSLSCGQLQCLLIHSSRNNIQHPTTRSSPADCLILHTVHNSTQFPVVDCHLGAS